LGETKTKVKKNKNQEADFYWRDKRPEIEKKLKKCEIAITESKKTETKKKNVKINRKCQR